MYKSPMLFSRIINVTIGSLVIIVWFASISYYHLSAVTSSTPCITTQSLVDSPSRTIDNTYDKFQLAREQSLGFFDDIPEEQWKRAQHIHTKIFPNHSPDITRYSNLLGDKRDRKALEMSSHWYGHNFHEEFHCPLSQRLPTGGVADGPKWICDPHRLSKKRDCLVYSFGSNGNKDFEQGIRDDIGDNCEIHTFDLNGANEFKGNFTEILLGLSTFHQWGLGYSKRKGHPNRLKSLQRTMKELGHEGRTIDILKIDCEWCEWITYRDWLKVDIRQLLVETHNAPMPNVRDFFFNFHDAGFVIFSKEANYINGAGGVEYAFLKLSTDFFRNDTMYNKQIKR